MNTGEGKTLTATLPAATAALAGLPVHVITTNDYLVERDAQIMTPLYQALGLSVAWVSMEMDPAERRRAYRADIVYCSNKTLVFDYLRDLIVLDDDKDEDRLRLERLRGGEGASASCSCAACASPSWTRPTACFGRRGAHAAHHFGRAGRGRRRRHRPGHGAGGGHARGTLPDPAGASTGRAHRVGREHLRLACAALPAPWGIPFRREELILSALTVLHLYRLDEQYIVRDGKVMVVDEFTGRVMPDRSWGQGLQDDRAQGRPGTQRSARTLKSISYQRFFKHYLLLAGMTGTAAEIRASWAASTTCPWSAFPRIASRAGSTRRTACTGPWRTNGRPCANAVARCMRAACRC